LGVAGGRLAGEDFDRMKRRIISNANFSGPNWVEFLTLGYNASQVLTYNLADGGATIDAALAKPWRPTVRSLTDQVKDIYIPNYSKQDARTPWKSENTLFAFWIGINDVGNIYWNENRTVANQMFKEYADLVEQVGTGDVTLLEIFY
jgi:hypothetical protein